MMTKRRLLNFSFIFILFGILIGCQSDPSENDPKKKKVNIPNIKLIAPFHESQYTIGDPVTVKFNVNNPDEVNELSLFIDDTLYLKNIDPKSQSITIQTKNSKVGFISLYLSYQNTMGKEKGFTRNIVFFSDHLRKQKIATVIKEYNHSTASYTQGLEFYNGKLYESTGSGDGFKSFLSEVDLATGKQLKSVDLNPAYFGEGITLLNDTIYQLTWEDQKCIVYNLQFEKIREFDYEGQGWGLCNNGKSLIMTNGSSEIVWRNPHNFAVEKKIYAFNQASDITNLNELELIDGNLFINVYLQNYLVEVDTTTGKVLAKIDCAGIVQKGQIGNANVLNGIAYNPITGKTYLTGKLWPKLYEVNFE